MGGILLGALLGPAVQLQQEHLWSPAAYGVLAAVGLGLGLVAGAVGRSRAGRPISWALMGLVAVSLVSFSFTGLRAQAIAQQALSPALEGRDILVRGVIAGMPQRGELGSRFIFDIETAQLDAAPVTLPPRVLLSWFEGPQAAPDHWQLQRNRPHLQAGDRWEFTVRLRAPHGNRNPHGFDHELWMWERGIQATGSVRAGPRERTPVRTGSSPSLALERLRQSVRDGLLATVSDPAQAGVLAGLSVGDQQAIERTEWDLFRVTGVAHLMSISGLHVTMFAWAAAAVVGALWRRSARLCLWWPAPHAAMAGGVLLAALYAAFSGGGLPAQRTVWMLATVGVLRLAGLRWPWPHVWLLAAAVVVTFDPWGLLQAGFWLSFVAVGVLFATDSQEPAPIGLWARVRALLREQWVITVALAPLTLLLFGQVSLVGLLANLVAIPWVTAVITPLALAGALWSPLWQLGAWAVGLLSVLLHALAVLPGAVLSAAAAPPWMALAALGGGLLLVMRLPPALRLMGLPLVLPMLLWQPPRPALGQIDVLAADIGQGNAVVVRTATHSLLYDAGPRYSADSDAGHRVLVPLLRALGLSLDAVVVSHRDNDHIGGAASVLGEHGQARLLSSIEPGHPLAARYSLTRCLAGQRWTWDGVEFEFLHPRPADYDPPERPPNAMSCVLKIRASGATALLAGDIEWAQERRLVLQAGANDGLRADLLLVPHHGSKTSSSDAFLDAVQPRIALVQSGYRNRFGHPVPAVVARYQQRGIAIVNSPQCGAARWSSAQPLQVHCERDLSRRYWQHQPP